MQLSKHCLIDFKESKCVKWVDYHLIMLLHEVIMCITTYFKQGISKEKDIYP